MPHDHKITTDIHVGDCCHVLASLPDQSVNCCVTSPPYWGLRDYDVPPTVWPEIVYGTLGGSVTVPEMECCLGLEPTPDAFVGHLVHVFREVRRVLKDDGTLWLNLGDSFANGGRSTRATDAKLPSRGMDVRPADPVGIKPKDLIGIPWRVAFAFQADGWFLRQDIIWYKPNAMPESVRDRCTKAHEYVFLLSKSKRYYYDSDAIKEPASKGNAGSELHTGKTGVHQQGRASTKPRTAGNKNHKYVDAYEGSPTEEHRTKAGLMKVADVPWETRNKRSVWTIASRPYAGAHFATMPPELAETCVLAGCPEGGTVLDPFGGSGTTAGVAKKHWRKAIVCELNEGYAALMPDRIDSIAGSMPLLA